jgi:hypothetical protein
MENATEAVKLAVLQQKFADFVNVVNKIDDAIVRLIDANVNVSKMLAVHEERIEQAMRSDELIMKMIDDGKTQNTVEHHVVIKRLETVEKTVTELTKFKWQTLALSGSAIVIIGFIVPFLDNLIAVQYNGGSQQTQTK